MTNHNPYAASQASLEVAPEEEGEEHLILAPRISRLFASLIDYFLLDAAPISYSTFKAAFHPSENALTLISPQQLSILVVLAVATWNLVLMYRESRSIGKWFMKLRVVRSDGSPCSLPRYLFLRVILIGGIVMLTSAIKPAVGIALFLLDTLPIFGPRMRCLHDIVGGTRVVKVR